MDTPYIAQNPVDDFGLRFTAQLYSATLAASTDTTLTTPNESPRYKAVMKCEPDSIVYVATGATAIVPVGATFAAGSSELIPVNGVLCREVKAEEVLHFITPGTDIDVSVAFYAIGSNN